MRYKTIRNVRERARMVKNRGKGSWEEKRVENVTYGRGSYTWMVYYYQGYSYVFQVSPLNHVFVVTVFAVCSSGAPCLSTHID